MRNKIAPGRFELPFMPPEGIVFDHWTTGLVRKLPLKDFLNLYTQHPHSRLPVYQDSTDNVVGILAIRDILIALAKNQLTAEDVIDSLIRPAIFVPETKRLSDLLNEMQTSGIRLALVVDEYGGIAGIITLQQMIEVIVGQIRDELIHELEFKTIDANTFEVEGGMTIDAANEELELMLPKGNYETLAGFVLNHLGHIPRVGEQIKQDKLKIVITHMKGLKIDKVRITRVEPDPPMAA